ncbi:hypothetical protein CN568_06605 [Bacillus pseudomycoides]|uniref:hypothetical protein n=1 Tax=Bacillus pseudomycoides TaxID=64104 RepID=UPI000BF1FD31|nr:hypothetical protein [Bacillus pseudomycoides]PEK30481.1 hypothetical protein CN691_19855 [Bacillus pseudomycoides]PEK68176.1 hypothetical protein CN593_12215 [Bacillus pseudomycoides]PEP44325.1 hypothetical protein CN565_06050 [Bacillus pseudomycoides]PEP46750.1 hypothetical protein CN568_06605 [Bacillus pseudomycoides]PFX48491.1 hypothetical protein COL31_21925 [Bacillus pseudomycoides]
MDYMKDNLIPLLEELKKEPTKENVTEILKEFGVQSPEYWAKDEIEGKEAVLASFRFLRPFQEILDMYLYNNESWVQNSIQRANEQATPDTDDLIMKEMVQAGISPEKIGLFAYWIARSAVNEILYRLSDAGGGDYDLPNEGEDLPSWRLEEYTAQSGNPMNVERTGRLLLELHNIFPFHNPGEK